MGSDLLAAGQEDTVVVAGVDSVTTSMYGLLDRVTARRRTGSARSTGTGAARSWATGPRRSSCAGRSTSPARTAAPTARPAAPRPYRPRARRPAPRTRAGQGALGRLLGVSVTCDAHHVTAPTRAASRRRSGPPSGRRASSRATSTC
ncbi:hypothetical protein NKH77_20505 [Streptomyces sp. M19]